jgi:hypothetical protein
MKKSITRRNWMTWGLPLLVACLTILGPARTARANESLISGSLSTHLVPCATLCTSGTISGSLSGSFNYTMATMTATSDPNVFILTGTFVIATSTGTVTGSDTTLWDVSTGQFTDMGRFTGGTGGYCGAEGKIVIIGIFDINAGTGQSNYTGKLETD